MSDQREISKGFRLLDDDGAVRFHFMDLLVVTMRWGCLNVFSFFLFFFFLFTALTVSLSAFWSSYFYFLRSCRFWFLRPVRIYHNFKISYNPCF